MENLNDEGIFKSYVLNTNDLNVNRILYLTTKILFLLRRTVQHDPPSLPGQDF